MHLWNNFVDKLILSVMIDSVQHDRICILPSSLLYQNLWVQNGVGRGGGGDTMWIADGRIKQRLYTNNAGSGLCNK